MKYLSDDRKKFLSWLRPGSGHEHLIEPGKEYIFSYTDFQENQGEKVERTHFRMDLLQDELQAKIDYSRMARGCSYELIFG